MKEALLLETIYLILLIIPTLFIYLKTRKLYKFSGYKGINYYSKAFLFLSIGFIIRYIVMISKILQNNFQTIQEFNIITIIMEFFLIVPGLFLLYSMIWQRFEKSHYSHKFTISQLIIYFIALSIALIDMYLGNFIFMYTSQILIFFIASIISYNKYLKNKNNFLQLYFISMILFLFIWIINLIAQFTIDIIPILRVYTYLFTTATCFTLLYITINLLKEKNEKKTRKV
jgi:hypothetical protein